MPKQDRKEHSHELKTDPEVFTAVWEGVKPWEIRKNDRDYQAGEKLLLRETEHTGEEMKAGKPLIYTGREILARIVYVLYGPVYGLAFGWCIMSIEVQLLHRNRSL